MSSPDHDRVLDVDVDQRHVFLGVLEEHLPQEIVVTVVGVGKGVQELRVVGCGTPVTARTNLLGGIADLFL